MSENFYDVSKVEWERVHSEYGPRVELEAVWRMEEIYYERMKSFYESGGVGMPEKFVEIGASLNPLVRRGVAARMHSGKRASVSVLLADYGYVNGLTRYRGLNAIRYDVERRVDYWPSRSPGDKRDVPPEGKQMQYQFGGGRLKIAFSTRGIPELVVPKEFDSYNLALVNVANYVKFDDLCRVLDDNRIKSVVFVNGSSLGGSQVIQPEERLGSSLDIVRELRSRGFERLDSVFTYYDDRKSELSRAPILGVFMIRPGNEGEAEWIDKHRRKVEISEQRMSRQRVDS